MKFNNRNIFISEKANIGKNVKIGDNSYIYDNVIIEDNTIISNNCVIGEPSVDYYNFSGYVNKSTIIGKNCLIRSHAIIYNGNTIGNNVYTGHRIMLRENNIIGEFCRIGNYTELHGNVKIGKYSNLHSSVCIVENSVLGNFVWISPGTILTNDITPPSYNRQSPVIGDFTFIAGMVTDKFSSKHPDILSAVSSAIALAEEVIRDNPEEAVTILKKEYSIPEETLLSYLTEGGLVYSDEVEGLSKFIEFMKAEGYIEKGPENIDEILIRQDTK